MSAEDKVRMWAGNKLIARGIDFDQIISVYEEQQYEGYCETCYYEWIALRVSFVQNGIQDSTIIEYTMYDALMEILDAD